jgi:hypothetical protein
MTRPIAMLCAAAMLVSGCATTPPMTVHYYLPRADLDVTVKKTVSCDPNDKVFTVLSATHDLVYSASSPATDKDAVQEVDIGRLDGFLSDADVGFAFTDDGRLKGVNVASTGEAGAIVKSALALAAPILGSPPLAMAGAPESRFEEVRRACEKIAAWGGKDKVLTLTYVTTIPFASRDGGATMMAPDASSATYDEALGGVIGAVCVNVARSIQRPPMGMPASGRRGDIALMLREPALARVEIDNWDQVTCGEPRSFETSDGPATKTVVWSGEVAVPQHGTLYAVLIPKAAAFGKENFTLTLSDAGTVTELKYGKTNGTADALGAVQAAEGTMVLTPAQKAQRATDEINAIAAQEKLAACQADHSKCGS